MRLAGALAGVAAAALLAAGCGAAPPAGASMGAGPASPPPTTRTSADEHGWHAAVRRDGSQLVVTLTVTGPLQVTGGCRPALAIWVEDASGAVVGRAPEETPGAARCGAVAVEQVPAGQVRSFEVRIGAPQAGGTYTIHGMLATLAAAGATPAPPGAENLPVLTVQV